MSTKIVGNCCCAGCICQATGYQATLDWSDCLDAGAPDPVITLTPSIIVTCKWNGSVNLTGSDGEWVVGGETTIFGSLTRVSVSGVFQYRFDTELGDPNCSRNAEVFFPEAGNTCPDTTQAIGLLMDVVGSDMGDCCGDFASEVTIIEL